MMKNYPFESPENELRSEYDFSTMPGGVKGKYIRHADDHDDEDLRNKYDLSQLN